jgi:hypothetical protein
VTIPQTPVLEITKYLDLAERQFLIESQREFIFQLRRKNGDSNFYSRLDEELRTQNILRVQSFREVKEGFAWISRPASLILDLETLLRERPYLSLWRGEIEALERRFTFIDVRGFLRSESVGSVLDLAMFRSCLEVLNYLADNRSKVSGLLPRQLPHGQSTKLIGKEPLLLRLFAFWRQEASRWSDFFHCFELLDKPLEFRFFAPECRIQGQKLRDFNGLFALDWIRDYNFSDLEGTLIIENFESLLALTRESTSSLLIWGAGWRAVHLKSLLMILPKPIYYWGDIDKEGYEIFASFKASCPEIEPVLMSRKEINLYQHIHQRKEIFLGPYRTVPGLQAEYEYVSRSGILIEQEQLRETWPLGTTLR